MAVQSVQYWKFLVDFRTIFFCCAALQLHVLLGNEL